MRVMMPILSLVFLLASSCSANNGQRPQKHPGAKINPNIARPLRPVSSTLTHDMPETSTEGDLHELTVGQQALPNLQGQNAPIAIGETRSMISGCLAIAKAQRLANRDYNAPRVAVEESENPVELRIVPGALYVAHKLRHPCCLDAKIKMTRQDELIMVDEILSGESCRCLCKSTLYSALGLPAGDYTLRLRVLQNNELKSSSEHNINIKARARAHAR